MASQMPSALGHMATCAAALGATSMPMAGLRSFRQGPQVTSPFSGISNSMNVPVGVGSSARQQDNLVTKPMSDLAPIGTALLRERTDRTLVGCSEFRGSSGKLVEAAVMQPGTAYVRKQAPPGSRSPDSRPSSRLGGRPSLPGITGAEPLQKRLTKSGQPRLPLRPARTGPIRAAKGGVSKSAPSPEAARAAGAIRKGMLLEFERDSTRTGFGVVHRPDGKAKWIVMDQHGNTFSIKPQQVTHLVASTEDYTAADIVTFLQDVDSILEPGLLELAWSEVGGNPVTPEVLAEMLFVSDGAVECYAVRRMLAADKIYFKRRKGSTAIFEPRPPVQVEELRVTVAAEEAVEREKKQFAEAVKAVLLKPRGQRLTPATWQANPLLAPKLAAMRAYALDVRPCNTKLAEESLDILGVPRVAASATELLLRLGVLPQHLNLELLRSEIPQEFSAETLALAQEVITNPPPDLDEALRVDLTHLKVYTIDSEDTEEIDDGLSVEQLADGRLRVWVHVADPSRWVRPRDELDIEALRRGTSVYLCTGKVPMFPLSLAAGAMSLRQGQRCAAMSVGATLHADGSLAESEIVNSYVRPTYRLTYEDVEEVLCVAREEEAELGHLADMARRRREWRMSQGAVEIQMPETDIKVLDPESDEPTIHVRAEDPSAFARQLVAEMMILSGEAAAKFGGEHNLPLPYRGQAEPDLPEAWELASIPKGPCTAVVLRRCMTRSETSCERPIPHASLGLAGYVQFTSPIRRYGDMLAHYQVKATLRGEKLPYSSAQLEAAMTNVALRMRESRRLENLAQRYWLLEHLRRQPWGTPMEALILRFLRDDDPSLIGIFIHEIGFETVMRVTRNVKIGEAIQVVVTEADPRKDVLRLQEAELFERINSTSKDFFVVADATPVTTEDATPSTADGYAAGSELGQVDSVTTSSGDSAVDDELADVINGAQVLVENGDDLVGSASIAVAPLVAHLEPGSTPEGSINSDAESSSIDDVGDVSRHLEGAAVKVVTNVAMTSGVAVPMSASSGQPFGIEPMDESRLGSDGKSGG